MRNDTRETIRRLMRWVVSHPIPITWRSNSPMPSPHGRKGRKRGSTGYDLVSRGVYEPGDDPRTIDWNATAQVGGQEICTVQYREPRDVKFFVLVDCGKSMEFGTYRTVKRLLAAELTGSIIKSAEETGDRVGLVAYSEQHVERFLPVKAAKVMLFPSVATVVEASAIERAKQRRGQRGGATADDGKTGLMKALRAVNQYSRSLIFIISDFIHMSEDEKVMLKKAAVRHDVVCICVQDLRQRELPDAFGLYTFQDMSTGKVQSVWSTKNNREKFKANFELWRTSLTAFFRQAHCDWTEISTHEGEAAFPKLMRLFAGHRR